MPSQETKRITLIAAMSEKDRVIGKDNALPWRISADMKHFREATKGQTIIMGRMTYDSIGRPLPNRTNVVITKDNDFVADGCLVTHSLEEALKVAHEDGQGENIYIIGGGQVYAQAIRIADRLDLTVVKGEFEGDTFFPDYSDFDKVIFREEREQDGYQFTFVILER